MPFIDYEDRSKPGIEGVSLSNFEPKRYALSYNPPTISKCQSIPNFDQHSAVLEYLVPSTGKLYHHKMRLRRLTSDSDVEEMLAYLEKRHPLYFMQQRMNKT